MGEHRLVVHVATARDRAGRRLPFANEYLCPLPLAAFLVEMMLAVLQLRNPDRDRLGPFARQLLHFLQFLPQLLRVLGLRDDLFRDLFVAIEKVQQLFADVVHERRC